LCRTSVWMPFFTSSMAPTSMAETLLALAEENRPSSEDRLSALDHSRVPSSSLNLISFFLGCPERPC
jgi:hypothetical protein